MSVKWGQLQLTNSESVCGTIGLNPIEFLLAEFVRKPFCLIYAFEVLGPRASDLYLQNQWVVTCSTRTADLIELQVLHFRFESAEPIVSVLYAPTIDPARFIHEAA